MIEMMNNEQILNQMNQMANYQKAACNTMVNSMTMAFTRTEKIMEMFANQAFWISDKWKNSMADWTNAYWQECEVIKKTVENNLTNMGKFRGINIPAE